MATRSQVVFFKCKIKSHLTICWVRQYRVTLLSPLLWRYSVTSNNLTSFQNQFKLFKEQRENLKRLIKRINVLHWQSVPEKFSVTIFYFWHFFVFILIRISPDFCRNWRISLYPKFQWKDSDTTVENFAKEFNHWKEV